MIDGTTMHAARRGADKIPGSPARKRPKVARPEIYITTEERQVNDEAIAALAHDQDLFHRGGMLVRLVRDDTGKDTGITWTTGPRIEPLPKELLRERLAAAAVWKSVTFDNEGTEREKIAHPPAWCVGAVSVRGQYPGMRPLLAVVDHPVMRADGTLLDEPGYDRVTGLYFDASEDDTPIVPFRPTRQEAEQALSKLFAVLADFPFENEAHKAAWLAALLTPLARFAFRGAAPLFLVDANVRGAGKGLLLDIISEILTGKPFTIATYTDDENEMRKRILSLALAGERLVLWDNLAGAFGNAILDAALTGTAWTDRLLGTNRTASAPLLMTWYATGNNVAIHADTARRICHIRLESPEEQPELRQGFQHPNLRAHVHKHRTELLGAALTILRGYVCAGRPRMGLASWGSYEAWSALVRSTVVWIGMPDPALTRQQLQERSDVTAESMNAILACWEQMDPTREGSTTAQVIARLKETNDSSPVHMRDFRDAVEAMLGKLDAKALGYRVRAYKRRIFNGRFLDQAGISTGAKRWAVFPSKLFSAGLKHDHHDNHDHHAHSCDGGDGGDVLAPPEVIRDAVPEADRGDAWEGP